MTTIDGDSGSLVLDLPIGPAIGLSDLRGRITDTLTDLGADFCYDVLLVATELVSNVLDHTPGTGRIRVLRGVADGEITIEVDDTSSQLPVRGCSRLGSARGRGVVMVDMVCHTWGTRSLADGGKTVYARVRRSGD
ncbi:ATP-binding protein [Lentzea sp. JNUCC 0626]|uniref:ATP-binding protein n=1 Tax=Lentzea sp. JNUCC 0626 TaxID=3367513 RepID=UPI00374A3297